MTSGELSQLKNRFDETSVHRLLAENGLELVQGFSIADLISQLNDVAYEHYWNEFLPPKTPRDGGQILYFDALANSSVTPSRLLDRLVSIEKSAKRVVAGRSRRPAREKVEELLGSIGHDGTGRPLRYSGTELSGHGGSERSAISLSMIYAINASERPPKPYRPKQGDRPWASQRLTGSIQSLANFVQGSNPNLEEVRQTAQDIHIWAAWCVQQLKGTLNHDKARHHGKPVLDVTLASLAKIYCSAFGKQPSAHVSSVDKKSTHPWIRFAEGALMRILAPQAPPSTAAIERRWQRLPKETRQIFP